MIISGLKTIKYGFSNRWLSAALAALLLTQISACGFQLRGSQAIGAMPFAQAQLELAPGVNALIADATASQLEQAGVELVQESAWVITLTATQVQVSQTSTNGLGDAASELIKMTQGYRVTQKTGSTDQPPAIKQAAVSASRDRRIDQNAMLAGDAELQQIKLDMADELAQKLVYRLSRSFAEPE
ncbi:hypothetical protein [Thiomicrorhabdus sediminis]|uniref:LPS-assembly lipoprotein LptE n=1 Tax=Thiomicrorhabdus sediminis TaxID=2580412 RepID=UPI00143D17DB|nr:hypothetical protein [Thiomicrorhabdus sediminis]